MPYASIFVPNFMIQAAVRAEPALRERALALMDGNPPLCTVAAVNEKASRTGVTLGMTKVQAGQFTAVEIRSRPRLQEKTAHQALLDIGWSASPRIEDAAEDAIVLDLSGLGHVFPSPEALAACLMQRSSECGLFPNVAIASNIETALIAARGFTGVTVIPDGKELENLHPLPVGVLSLSKEIAETLDRWGIRTCGAFAELPILQLSERLGQEGVRLHALARGAGSRSLKIAEPASTFEEEMELDDAVEDLEPLSFLLGRLLDQLCTRLTARSLAASAIRLRFELQPSFENAKDRREAAFLQRRSPGLYETNLELPIPVRDSKLLLKLFRLRLQSKPPAAPIQKIALLAEFARPRVMQSGLFAPQSPEPEKLDLTIARIAHVVGESNVGSPSLADTHHPEEFHMERFLIASGPGEAKDRNTLVPETQNQFPATCASFRTFRPSLPAKLELHGGRPARATFQGMRAEVLAASGPWRTSGDWWRENPWQQDEWDLEIRFFDSGEQGLYRFYYDALQQGWFVRGIYD
jgi:protein ImuB